MADIYADLEPERAMALQSLARLAYDTREARAGLLRYHDVGDEEALLARIVDGVLPEHPAYEHYLAARILEQTRQAARAQIAGRHPLPVLHLAMRERVQADCAAHLAGEPQLTQDALVIRLSNGMTLTVHAASADEYSFSWQGDAGGSPQERIDTAPVHGGPAVHRHGPDGRIVPDTLTDPARDPGDNLCALVRVLVAGPDAAPA